MERSRTHVHTRAGPPEFSRFANSYAMEADPAVGPQPSSIQKSRLSGGFLPLPSILASPLETPSTSTSPDDHAGPPHPPTNLNRVSVHCQVVVSTPTWKSTPPTPPTKSTRHTSACLPQGPDDTTPVSPLASFYASMHPHAGARQTPRLKKCFSVPNLLGRSNSFSRGSASLPSCPPFFERTMELNRGRRWSFDSGCDEDTSVSRKKAIFHISHPTTDNEDESVFHSAESRPHSRSDDHSPARNWTEDASGDVWGREKSQDERRKFHALQELLSTEISYLADLKALITVRNTSHVSE